MFIMIFVYIYMFKCAYVKVTDFENVKIFNYYTFILHSIHKLCCFYHYPAGLVYLYIITESFSNTFNICFSVGDHGSRPGI